MWSSPGMGRWSRSWHTRAVEIDADRSAKERNTPAEVRAEALAGDASSRCYTRLHEASGLSRIEVRYHSTERSRLERDLAIRRWLETRGLRVPALFDENFENGRAVLEDFGPQDASDSLRARAAGDRLAAARRLVEPLEGLAQLELADLPPWNPPLAAARLR